MEHAKSEGAFKASKTDMSFPLNVTAKAIYGIDLEGNCTFADPSCLRLLGYTDIDLLVGKNMHHLIHYAHADGSSIPSEECRIQQVLRDGKDVHADDEVLWRADGSYFPVEYWSYPQMINGKVSGAIVICINSAKQSQTENRERFQELIETLYDWVWEVDCQGRYTYLSPQIKQILGYNPHEILGKTPFDLMPQEEAKRVLKIFNTLVAEQSPVVGLENIHLHKDGHPVVLETNGLPFYDTDGNLQGYRGTNRDITQRKQTEAAFAESEKRFSIFMEHVPASVFIKDHKGRFIFGNQYFNELFGVEEYIGKTTDELIPQKMAQRMTQDDRKVMSNGPMVIREKIIDKDGEKRFFDTYKFPIKIAGSDPLLAGIAVETTERINTERKLAETQILLQSAFAQTPVPMVLVREPGGIIIHINQALIEILGMEDDLDHTGLPLTEIYPTWKDLDTEGHRIPWDEVPLMLALKGIPTHNKEMIVERKDGTRSHAIVSAAPIYNSAGEMLAAFAVFPDITKLKVAEEALEKRIMALTRPFDIVEGIAFEDLFNLNEIQHLQDMLAKTWGVAMLLTGPGGTPITRQSNFSQLCGEFIRTTEKGARNCQMSDSMLGRHEPSGPIIQQCLSAGLWCAGASITVGGHHIANWLVGQVRNEAQSEEQIMEYARKIGVDEIEFRKAFLQVPVMSNERFNQIAHTLFALANQISTIAYQNIQQARFITDLKQTEEALRKSEFLLRQTQQISKIAGWVYDTEKNEHLWTGEVYKIYGVTPEEYDPNNLSQDVAFYENSSLIEEAFRRAVDFGEPYDLELKFRNAHGKSLWVRTMGQAELRNDKVVRVYGNIMDITDRKQAEHALIESEKRFRTMTDTSPLAIYMSHGIEQKAEYINPTFTKLFGYTIEEVPCASEWFLLAYPDEVYRNQVEKAWNSMVKHVIRTRARIEPMESIVTCKDGTKKHISWGFISTSEQNWTFGLDVTESKEAEKKIRHMANHDGLTDLPTLRLARDRLAIAMGVARRKKMTVAVMFADLDGFKEVNDTYGHDIGDEVLKEAAQRFRSSVREIDTVARIGGDEFLIIATELHSPENAAHIAQKVIQGISQPIIVDGKEASVGASIGIALYPRDGNDIDRLIKLADKAMYRVKNSSKNDYTFVNSVDE